VIGTDVREPTAVAGSVDRWEVVGCGWFDLLDASGKPLQVPSKHREWFRAEYTLDTNGGLVGRSFERNLPEPKS
jgi:hypothetical protein